MEHYPFMVECLKEMNYPHINSMDEMEIMSIFSQTNRPFLVSWLFTQIDEEFTDIVRGISKEMLADLLCYTGYCNDGIEFLNAKCDHDKQLLILYKMFKDAKDLSLDDNTGGEKVSCDEIQNFMNFNTNLFPTMFGTVQTLTHLPQLHEVEQENAKLKSSIDSIEMQEQEEPLNFTSGQELEATVKQLETSFPNFKRQVLDVLQKSQNVYSEEVKCQEDISGVLETSADNFRIILEFLKSINAIAKFKSHQSTEEENTGNDGRSINMMRQIAELCNEISALKRDIPR